VIYFFTSRERPAPPRFSLAKRPHFDYSWEVSVTGIVKDNAVKLPVPVPDGTRVEIVLPEELELPASKPAGSFFESVRDLVGSVEGPPDWVAEHDHYVHGKVPSGTSRG